MTTKSLLESATLVETTSEGPWKVRLISEGKGSSGIYSAQLLEKYHAAFDGVLSFENHPIGWDGPETRNFTQIVGKILGETWIETDDRGRVGVYGHYDPDPENRDRLARYKENLGLSIFIEGDGHANEDGDFEVDSFNEHDPYASIDVVIAAGRGGRFEESLKNMYANRRTENKPTTESSVEELKETDMDEIKELTAVVSALATKVETLVSAQEAKAVEEAQLKVDTEAVEKAIEAYAAQDVAITAAELLPTQANALRAEAKRGVDVAPLLEKATKERDEILAEATKRLDETKDPEGRIVGSETGFKSGAWA